MYSNNNEFMFVRHPGQDKKLLQVLVISTENYIFSRMQIAIENADRQVSIK
jgi:hypothetical protein